MTEAQNGQSEAERESQMRKGPSQALAQPLPILTPQRLQGSPSRVCTVKTTQPASPESHTPSADTPCHTCAHTLSPPENPRLKCAGGSAAAQ